MRAETKAIIASVLVIALALTAVSGVTYSWWSDSESAEITISTGKMDLTISENDMKLTAGTEEVSGFAPTMGGDGRISVSFGIAPPDSAETTRIYTLTYKAVCTNSVDSCLVVETKADLDWLWVTNVAGQKDGDTAVAGTSYNDVISSGIVPYVKDTSIEVAPGTEITYDVTIKFVVDLEKSLGKTDGKLELCTTLVQEDGTGGVNKLN